MFLLLPTLATITACQYCRLFPLWFWYPDVPLSCVPLICIWGRNRNVPHPPPFVLIFHEKKLKWQKRRDLCFSSVEAGTWDAAGSAAAPEHHCSL